MLVDAAAAMGTVRVRVITTAAGTLAAAGEAWEVRGRFYRRPAGGVGAVKRKPPTTTARR